MCDLRLLIYRLVISKSVKVASSLKQGWQYGMVCKYDMVRLNICSGVRYAGTIRLFLQWYGYGTLVRYASKIELKYGTLVRYGLRCEVRSTQILNVRTVLPSLPRTIIIKTDYGKFSVEGSKQSIDS